MVKGLIASRLMTCMRYQNTSLVTSTSACPLRCRAPASDSTRLPGPVRVRQPVTPSRPAAPAGHPRPADPVGYCGRQCVAGHCGLEPAMRSRRWRSDAVGLPGPAHGCPELVKPILHTDIGVGVLSHPSGRASRVDLQGRGASSPSPPPDPIGPARGRSWSISRIPVLQSGGAVFP